MVIIKFVEEGGAMAEWDGLHFLLEKSCDKQVWSWAKWSQIELTLHIFFTFACQSNLIGL